MFVKFGEKLVNMDAVEEVQANGNLVYLQGASRTSVVEFPDEASARKALKSLALELQAKGRLLTSLSWGKEYKP